MWATAPDGKQVPIDVVRRVDTPFDGTAAVLRLRLRLVRGLDAAVVLGAPGCRGSIGAAPGRSSTRAAAASWGAAWYLDGKLLAKRNTFTDTLAACDHLVETGVAAPRPGRDPRRQRRWTARRRLRHDRTRTVQGGRRRGPVRRRRDDDERPVAAAHRHRVGGVGRPAPRAVRVVHARATRRTTTPGRSTTRRCTSRPGSTTHA